MKPAVLILMAALPLACTPTYDLTPTLAEGTAGHATFSLHREARFIVGSDRMRNTMTGRLDIQVTRGGAFGSEPVTLTSVQSDLSMEREAEGSVSVFTATPDLADTLKPFFEPEGRPRTVTVAPDSSVTVEEGLAEALPTDVDSLFEPLRYAPAGKVPVGTRWHRTLRKPGDDGVQWYRTYKLMSVDDGVARIAFMDMMDDPVSGDLGPVEKQTRGEQQVDVATGLPYNLRLRDLSAYVSGTDVRATFHWPDLQTLEP